MKFISHRGNQHGSDPKKENKPAYIDAALNYNFDVEVDVWYLNDKWWLGHDEAQYKTTFRWLFQRHSKLWVHCKNLESLHKLTRRDKKNIWNGFLNYFWHQKDDFTLTSKGFIWTFPRRKLTNNSVCVCPEKFTGPKKDLKNCYGVCSDTPDYWRHYEPKASSIL